MKWILFLSLFAGTVAAFAQDKIGNGGGLWACVAQDNTVTKGMLVDLYEARSEFGLRLIASAESDPLAIVHERADFIKKYWPEMNQEWALVLEMVLAKLQFVDGPLEEVHDSFYRTMPAASEGCASGWRYTQFANFTNLGPVLVSRSLWDNASIPPLNKAALIWHEVIYRWLRDAQNEKDSIRTRAVVGFLFSDLPIEILKQRVQDILKPQAGPAKLVLKLLRPFDDTVLSGSQAVQFSVEAPLVTQPTVYLYIDEGVLIGQMLIAPYQFNLNTKTLPNGRHRLYGVLYTASGTLNSNAVTVTIKN